MCVYCYCEFCEFLSQLIIFLSISSPLPEPTLFMFCPMTFPWFSILIKSSTCMEGGRLVFGARERNGSCRFCCTPLPKPRPRIGATEKQDIPKTCILSHVITFCLTRPAATTCIKATVFVHQCICLRFTKLTGICFPQALEIFCLFVCCFFFGKKILPVCTFSSDEVIL